MRECQPFRPHNDHKTSVLSHFHYIYFFSVVWISDTQTPLIIGHLLSIFFSVLWEAKRGVGGISMYFRYRRLIENNSWHRLDDKIKYGKRALQLLMVKHNIRVSFVVYKDQGGWSSKQRETIHTYLFRPSPQLFIARQKIWHWFVRLKLKTADQIQKITIHWIFLSNLIFRPRL